MLLFHGTTLNRLLKIIQKGYLGTNDTIWNVSQFETTYFYSEKFVREEYSYEDTEVEEIKRNGISYALGSAEIALSLERQNLKRVVLIFDSSDLEKIGKLETDDSCGEKMDYCLKFSGKIPLSLIKEVWVDKESLDLFALYFIGLAYDRNHYSEGYSDGCFINSKIDNLDSVILKGAKQVYEILSTWFLEEMSNIDILEESSIEKLQRSEIKCVV